MRKIIETLLRNSALSLAAKVTYQIGNAFLFFLIARLYGSGEAGVYTLATRYTLLFLTLAGWGLDDLLTWKVSAEPSETPKYFVNHGLLRLPFSLISYLALGLFVYTVAGYNHHTVVVILILAISLLPDGVANLIQSTLNAHGNFVYPSIAALVVGSIRILFGGWVILTHGPLELVAIVQAGSSVIGLGVYGLLYYLQYHSTLLNKLPDKFDLKRYNWRSQLDKVFLRAQPRAATPFALSEIFITLEWQVDIILLSFFLTQNQVGLYAAAQTIVVPVTFALVAYDTALYPIMANLFSNNESDLWKLYKRLFLFGGIIMLPTAMFIMAVAKPLITFVYKAQYAPAAAVVPWLIWSIVVQVLNEPNARLIPVAGQPKMITRFLATSMATNIALNCFLIPHYGIEGAAWARLISTTVFALLCETFVLLRIKRINPLQYISRPFLGAALWGIILYVGQLGRHPLLGFIGGAAVYALGLWLTIRAVRNGSE